MPLYLVDANVLITAHNQYYPIDTVPQFWDWLLHQAENGDVKIPFEIYEEIKVGGKDGNKDILYKWVADSSVKKHLLLDEQVNPAHVARCTKIGYAPDLTDDELLRMGRDPFLIAYAMAARDQRCVVSNEVSAPAKKRQNRKIPDVCSTMGVQCCNVFAMTRALGFKTDWKK
ncbi:hypothetical protein ABIF38_005675 [Bradyrhizobium japonicum]|uniref:DUF4411 family protein n=1 Tax=Bradyrhizobium elkanii TaxID=29448 RepID=UPI00036F3264|nr:DUF4411 family protein [Bradyrhizobium elkanii]MBP2434746.1 hypothetical protein [Bradyrhizobium elkanii]MCP1732015.1 hypothetical protein [Bradyrhizobium elkanii]MCS3567349.1 hypothetical protein [Bradyrhizobium elkanii]MCS3591166.1 hypothetical protein [Bradyrhizobium elkanii]MCS3620609.1 hypothetical protein [Bradyrhizobium elkanii]